MASTINFRCTTSNCPTRVDERALTAGGIDFMHLRWVDAVRAGTVTTCEAHYHGANPAAYNAYIKGHLPRVNREKA